MRFSMHGLANNGGEPPISLIFAQHAEISHFLHFFKLPEVVHGFPSNIMGCNYHALYVDNIGCGDAETIRQCEVRSRSVVRLGLVVFLLIYLTFNAVLTEIF